MTRISTKEAFENPKRVFHSKRRLFETPSLVESSSLEFDLFSDIEEHSKEEKTAKVMMKTMEQGMSKTCGNYGSGVARPEINDKTHFELKGKFLKKLSKVRNMKTQNNTSKKSLRSSTYFISPRNEPSGSITNWETIKTKFLNKYCPPARTAKKMEEINNFQQEPDESLLHAWERFLKLLMKCPQHYLTDMQEVILFYKGLDVPTRQILDLKGAIRTKTVVDAKVAIQEIAEYSQKCHNGRSLKTKNTKTSDELASIQAQLNSLGREIKKVNEKVYAAQVGCELCKGPHYTKECPLKEEGKTLEEACYTDLTCLGLRMMSCLSLKDDMPLRDKLGWAFETIAHGEGENFVVGADQGSLEVMVEGMTHGARFAAQIPAGILFIRDVAATCVRSIIVNTTANHHRRLHPLLQQYAAFFRCYSQPEVASYLHEAVERISNFWDCNTFYGSEIYLYGADLKQLGVITDFKDGAKWIKTKFVYKLPDECLSFLSDWKSYVKLGDGPFIDE
uniref:Retrotransposon gag domain-containing protein n=1 Tax=Tanacetum cinerariifolium TaxID=118510 RepID=A0A6L2LK41_TANCI|nr:hypothetical protein [Tanacetum cinerariifolium]